MKTGVIIRDIRISKGIKSKELYKGILSRPAIVKFENGESDTASEKFFKILERLNITLEEFDVLARKQQNNDLYFTANYIQSFYEKDIQNLRSLAKLANQEYLKTGNVKYAHYSAICNLLVADLSLEDYGDEAKVIHNYLMKCNTWGYYELTLFTNTVSFYSNDLIDLVYKRAKKCLISYDGIVRYRNELAILLFNILVKKIKTKHYKSLEHYFYELKEIKDFTKDNMYFQAMIIYFSELVSYIKYRKIESISKINAIVSMFDVLGMESKAKQCKSLLNSIVQEEGYANMLKDSV